MATIDPADYGFDKQTLAAILTGLKEINKVLKDTKKISADVVRDEQKTTDFLKAQLRNTEDRQKVEEAIKKTRQNIKDLTKTTSRWADETDVAIRKKSSLEFEQKALKGILDLKTKIAQKEREITDFSDRRKDLRAAGKALRKEFLEERRARTGVKEGRNFLGRFMADRKAAIKDIPHVLKKASPSQGLKSLFTASMMHRASGGMGRLQQAGDRFREISEGRAAKGKGGAITGALGSGLQAAGGMGGAVANNPYVAIALAIKDAFKKLITEMLAMDSKLKGMRKEVFQLGSAFDIFGEVSFDLRDRLDSFNEMLMSTSENIFHMANRAERLSALSSFADSFGGSMEKAVDSMEKAYEVFKINEDIGQLIEGDLSLQIVNFARVVGRSVSEVAQQFGQLDYELGVGLSSIADVFNDLYYQATRSDLSVNKFLSSISGLIGQFDIFETQLRSAARLSTAFQTSQGFSRSQIAGAPALMMQNLQSMGFTGIPIIGQRRLQDAMANVIDRVNQQIVGATGDRKARLQYQLSRLQRAQAMGPIGIARNMQLLDQPEMMKAMMEGIQERGFGTFGKGISEEGMMILENLGLSADFLNQIHNQLRTNENADQFMARMQQKEEEKTREELRQMMLEQAGIISPATEPIENIVEDIRSRILMQIWKLVSKLVEQMTPTMLEILGKMVKGIGALVEGLPGKTFDELGKGLQEAGDDIYDAADQFRNAMAFTNLSKMKKQLGAFSEVDDKSVKNVIEEFQTMEEKSGLSTAKKVGQITAFLEGTYQELKNREDNNKTLTESQVDLMNLLENLLKENAHLAEKYRHFMVEEGKEVESLRNHGDRLRTKGAEALNSHQSGSLYTQEGPAYLHAGEMVIPQNLASLIRSGGNAPAGASTYNIDISIDGEGGDPQRIALAVRREMERIIRQSASMQQA
jgi:hypothetical protein